mgnify:FL=1
MSLLYPGIDDEDAMRWYDNVHGLLGGGHPHKPFPPAQDIPTPPVLHPDDPLGDNNMWLNPFNPPVTNPLIEYGSEDIKLHGSDPGYGVDTPSFDMRTAEGYESYLKSLSPTTEASPLSIAYDSYSGKPYTY